MRNSLVLKGRKHITKNIFSSHETALRLNKGCFILEFKTVFPYQDSEESFQK